MTTIRDEKVVAGLRCGQVLDRLSDYLDDGLPAPERDRVEAHLRGCEGCARFGGAFRDTVRALREHLTSRQVVMPRSLRDRLRRAIDSRVR